MTTTKPTYTEVPEFSVPKHARWTTPRANQGQMVEVSYSTGDPNQRDESGPGDRFRRVIDHSDRSVWFGRRTARCACPGE